MTTAWAAIVVAVLSLIGTLIGSYLANNRIVALMNYRLDQIEKKQDKHNNLIERMAIAERDLKAAFHRIDELDGDIHELRSK